MPRLNLSRLSVTAAEHGRVALPGRLLVVLCRRLRDRWWARRLQAPGFRAARSPRLLGGRALRLGPDFHARDFVWLEAVCAYQAGERQQVFSPCLRVGVSARLSDNVHIACIDRVTIGDHLLCGSGVLITDHAHGSYRGGEADGELVSDPMSASPSDLASYPPSDPATPPAQRPLVSAGPVVIGDNVWLGDGVAVLAGAVIGDGCVIGAHAVVTGTIAPGTIAVGAPARSVRRWDPATRAWLPIPKSEQAL